MVGRIVKVFLTPHLMQYVQPPLLPAGHHVRRHTRTAERRRKGNLRTGKRRFHERLPSPPVAELLVIPALSRHRAEVERPPLVQHLRFRRRPHIETLQAAAALAACVSRVPTRYRSPRAAARTARSPGRSNWQMESALRTLRSRESSGAIPRGPGLSTAWYGRLIRNRPAPVYHVAPQSLTMRRPRSSRNRARTLPGK